MAHLGTKKTTNDLTKTTSRPLKISASLKTSPGDQSGATDQSVDSAMVGSCLADAEVMWRSGFAGGKGWDGRRGRSIFRQIESAL
jgi:hypothetical protein